MVGDVAGVPQVAAAGVVRLAGLVAVEVLQDHRHAPERPVGQRSLGLGPGPLEALVDHRVELGVHLLDAAMAASTSSSGDASPVRTRSAWAVASIRDRSSVTWRSPPRRSAPDAGPSAHATPSAGPYGRGSVRPGEALGHDLLRRRRARRRSSGPRRTARRGPRHRPARRPRRSSARRCARTGTPSSAARSATPPTTLPSNDSASTKPSPVTTRSARSIRSNSSISSATTSKPESRRAPTAASPPASPPAAPAPSSSRTSTPCSAR